MRKVMLLSIIGLLDTLMPGGTPEWQGSREPELADRSRIRTQDRVHLPEFF
jgi:hypothetical protein